MDEDIIFIKIMAESLPQRGMDEDLTSIAC
jgi:hypothetical protein